MAMTDQNVAIHGDRPRKHLAEDELGYRSFAVAIAASLDRGHDSDGLVVGIHGPWGSGKTSAVNMIIEALAHRQAERSETAPTIVVRFNPWWFSEQTDLTQAFFGEMTVALGRQLSVAVKDGLRSIRKRVSGAGDFISALVKLTPAAIAADAIGAAIKSVAEGPDEEKTLQDLRDDLDSALRAEKRHVIVVIDDIDRLPADEARQLFRLVKSLGDLPYVTYLMVFDREIARRAMEKESDPEGPQWIEKIVQASFDLPPISGVDLHRMLFRGLDAIPGLTERIDTDRWRAVFRAVVAPWLRVPRDVERLLNSIRVCWPSVQDEVNSAEFIGLATLQLLEPKLYQFVRGSRERLAGAASSGSRNDDPSLKDDISAKVEAGRAQRARGALTELFPKVKASLLNAYTGDWRAIERERRLASKRHFDSYFRYTVGEDALPRRDLAQFEEAIGRPQDAGALLSEWAKEHRSTGGTRAGLLLNEWQAIAEGYDKAKAETAAMTFLQIADGFLTTADADSGPFGIPAPWQVLFVIEPLLKLMPPENRKALLIDAMKTSPSLKMITLLVGLEAGRHSPPGEQSSRPETEWLLSQEDLVPLLKARSARLRREAKDFGILPPKGDTWVVEAWRHDVGDDKARRWSDRAMVDMPTALALMQALTAIGQVITDRVTPTYSVDRADADKWVDVDRLAGMAGAIVLAGEPDQVEIAKRFLSGLARRSGSCEL